MTITRLSQAQLDSMPIGAMVAWPFNTVPPGYVAQASVLNRVAYPELNDYCAAGSYPFGNGNGSTTFSAPFGDPSTLPWNGPRGRIAKAQITANVGSMATTATDVTGLSVTFTAYANRRYKVTIQGGLDNAATGTQAAAFYLREGSTTMGAIFQSYLAANGANGDQEFGSAVWEGTLSAGSHTLKVSANFTSGSANIFLASATVPAFIMVEDIGADLTQAPYSSGQWIVKAYTVPVVTAGAPYIVVSSLPTVDNYEGRRAFSTLTSREYTYIGGAWRITGGKVPKVKAFKTSGSQAVTQNTFSTITHNSESYDEEGFHDNSTNPSRCTVPSGLDAAGATYAGRYRIEGRCAIEITTVGTVAINFLVNGSSVTSDAQLSRTDGGGSSLLRSTELDLTAGQYVEIQGYQNGHASGINYGTGASVTYLQLTYVGP